MKNSLLKSYYVRFVLNVITASVVLLAFVIFFVYNTIILSENKESINLYSIVLFVVFGVVAFAITFLFLERRVSNYIGDLYVGIERMSKGDLTTKLDVIGDDELSMIAFNINLMQDRINKLILSEKENEKAKSELVTNIAHDLRTPLTSVIGYLEILNDRHDLDDEKRNEYINIAYEKSKKLEILIEDLFSFTKMNYGDELVLKKERIDIVELLNQLSVELYPLFEKNNMECLVQSNRNSIMINLDPKLIVRLFENLINNAIKYGKEGKNIIIKIKDNSVLSMVDISIINYGRVIPNESLKKIFDQFYRVDDSRTSEAGGTGLGLAIAKTIVELHGGTITVKSDSDGTEFRVSFPKGV